VRDSEIFGSSMTFTDPVSRNWPGWHRRSMAALITGKSSLGVVGLRRAWSERQASKEPLGSTVSSGQHS